MKCLINGSGPYQDADSRGLVILKRRQSDFLLDLSCSVTGFWLSENALVKLGGVLMGASLLALIPLGSLPVFATAMLILELGFAFDPPARHYHRRTVACFNAEQDSTVTIPIIRPNYGGG
jgi:hypothetical protein